LNRFKQRQYLFHPITVLLASLIAAAIFALLVTVLFTGELRWFLLYYFTPVGIPFVAFVFDRAEHYKSTPKTAWAIDIVVLIPALLRAAILLPLVSGHALFLVYCFLTSRSKMARIMALLVFAQVVYLKIFVTHDTALFGGTLAGCLAAWIYQRLKPTHTNI
jgi:hypothetical protein